MDRLQEEVKKTSRFEIEAKADDILKQIDSLREIDKSAEGRQQIGCWILGVGIPLIGLGIFALASSSGHPLSFLPLGIGIAALIGGIFYRMSAGKLNLVDRRYELLGNLVDMVRRDMATEATLNARVDFRPATHKSKFQEKGQIGPWKVSFYSDPWLTLRGRFLDSTSFQIEITDLTQQRGQWKRSRSGKSKYKTKTKSASVATLRLKAKPQKYPGLENYASQVASNVVLPDWCELKNAAVTGDALSIKVGTKAEWEVPPANGKPTRYHGGQMVSMMFLSLYRVLNLCKGEGNQ